MKIDWTLCKLYTFGIILVEFSRKKYVIFHRFWWPSRYKDLDSEQKSFTIFFTNDFIHIISETWQFFGHQYQYLTSQVLENVLFTATLITATLNPDCVFASWTGGIDIFTIFPALFYRKYKSWPWLGFVKGRVTSASLKKMSSQQIIKNQ